MSNERFKTYEEVERFLNAIPTFGQVGSRAARFGLERMEQACRRLDNPEREFPVIHVAGTNGKGTTARMLASVFMQGGWKTGLYTSPHLVDFRERIRLDGEWVSRERVLEFFRHHADLLAEFQLSYFEITTLLALWCFARESCDIVILETGLGGRLDATNIVDPVVSVITSISFDHTDLLGDSLSEIAREKGGIIKPGRPVVIGPLADEAVNEIRSIARSQQSRRFESAALKPKWKEGSVEFTDETGRRWQVDGTGRKKIDAVNIATVFRVLQILEKDYPGLLEVFAAGVEAVGRRFPHCAVFERLHPDRKWYFDGAHNEAAVETLIEHIAEMEGSEAPVFVLSLMKEKVTPALLNNFKPFREVVYVDTKTERSAPCESVRTYLPRIRCYTVDIFEDSGLLRKWDGRLVIFTGSFYFYNQVKHWMASHSLSDQANPPGRAL